MAEDDDNASINLGYVLNQLRKAAAGTGEKFKQWQKVLSGLVDGTLIAGSRTPVEDAPAWVTLEVVQGGFATGNFAAGGPLQAHEQAALAQQRKRHNAPERTTLNLHYFAGDGRAEIERMLDDGKYRVHAPEEAALLSAAWLNRRGEAERSATLIQTIAPFFDRLRFYPVPHAEPGSDRPGIHLHTVGEAAASLRKKRKQQAVERMHEAIAIWSPLYDRAVALFLETVEGERPTLQRTAAGALARGPKSELLVSGGWPCRQYPAGWSSRARTLLDDYRTLRAKHPLCRKPDRPKENFARLRRYLEVAVHDPAKLSAGDAKAIRGILAAYVARHGTPDSVQRLATRTAQRHTASLPTHDVIARRVAEALDRHPAHDGLAELDAVLAPLASERALPSSIARKAARCLHAPLEVLVERSVFSSSESIAAVLPQLTARTRAQSIDDPALRRLFEATYIAFRRRRSLLLLDLESQVQFGELPWIDALSPWVGSDEVSREAARETLRDVLAIVFEAFPHTILPNKLLKEVRMLAAAAGLRLPLVDELAADIFTGSFAESYVRAAQESARVLHGTLYERYYGIPYAQLLELNDLEPAGAGTRVSPGFAALCRERTGVSAPKTHATVLHGLILEQAQVLTTHNLAVLFQALELAQTLPLPEMARDSFDWICRRQQQPQRDWRAQLHLLKDTAYAFRQLVFYLALSPRAEQAAFVGWTRTRLSRQKPEFRERFEPVIAGLEAAVSGETFDREGNHAASGGRRFLGWSVGTHWLLRRRAGVPTRSQRP